MFDHYPKWAKEFAQKYLSRTINQFILHGNVHDLVPLERKGGTDFVRLKSFLSEEFFGARDYVIFYDRSSGIYFRDQESRKDFNRALSGRDSLIGTDYANNLPKDPVRVFSLLEQYFRVRIDDKKSIGLIVDYADTIVPMNEAGSTGSEDRTSLVYLSRWAHDPMFLAADFTTVLISENLADLNKTLVQNPYTSDIKIEIPNQEQRLKFIDHQVSDEQFEEVSEVKKKVLAQQTAGLNFINLQGILSNARENREKITHDRLSEAKKELIEAEAYGLLDEYDDLPPHPLLGDWGVEGDWQDDPFLDVDDIDDVREELERIYDELDRFEGRVDDFGPKEYLYIAFITFSMWFITWGILLTTNAQI